MVGAGVREDLGKFFRSSWEANYARYLNFIQVQWEYESKIFYFPNVKNGAVSYKPDFYLCSTDTYVEIKGLEKSTDRTKWGRMKKFHPEVRLLVVDTKKYREIETKYGGLIPHWEHPEKKVAPHKVSGSIDPAVRRVVEKLNRTETTAFYVLGCPYVDYITFDSVTGTYTPHHLLKSGEDETWFKGVQVHQ